MLFSFAFALYFLALYVYGIKFSKKQTKKQNISVPEWLSIILYISVPEWLSIILYISVPEWLSIILYISVPEWLSIILYISVPEWLPIILYISVPEWLSITLYISVPEWLASHIMHTRKIRMACETRLLQSRGHYYNSVQFLDMVTTIQ